MSGSESQVCVWSMSSSMPKLVGWVHIESTPAFAANFRYNPQWLADPDCFALDPINLPLSDQLYVTQGRYSVLSGILDATPDAWGRTLMGLRDGTAASLLPERAVMLRGYGSGVGALVFANEGEVPSHNMGAAVSVQALEQIYKAAQDVIHHKTVDSASYRLMTSSWDVGGARPKIAVQDASGEQWIAKLPGRYDPFSNQRVEWANLEMARHMGIRVPATRLVELPCGDAALLVKRFDRSAGAIERPHYLSAVSLISPPENFSKRDILRPEGGRHFSYLAIHHVIQKVSASPSKDTAELFGRMALNILLHNTDDHLKNHGFLKESGSNKYRLSPLFDVVTQRTIGLNHSIHIGPQGLAGTLQNLKEAGAQMHLSAKFMDKAIATVQETLSVRRQFYELAGLPSKQQAQVERYLSPEISQPDNIPT